MCVVRIRNLIHAVSTVNAQCRLHTLTLKRPGRKMISWCLSYRIQLVPSRALVEYGTETLVPYSTITYRVISMFTLCRKR